jgi:hypothetical protein
MEVALRRRLAGVTEVRISQGQQTAEVAFQPGTRTFSAAEFRNAVAEADVGVVTLEVEACGAVDHNGVMRIADGSPLIRLVGENRGSGASVCVRGPLDDSVDPPVLHVVVSRPPID